MHIRFWKRIRLSKRFYVNVSKKGLSLSFKGHFVNVTFGKHGIRFTSGLHGIGLYFTEYKLYKKK